MDINKLHDEWIAAGQKADDLLNKKVSLTEKYHSDYQNMSESDKETFRKEMENVAQNYKDAVSARDFAKQTYVDAKAAEKPIDKKLLDKKETK